jgi:hypothetical protein
MLILAASADPARAVYQCPHCGGSFEALRANVKRGNTKSCRRGCKPYPVRDGTRYTLGARSLTLVEWSRETGIDRTVIWKRLKRGVPLEKALVNDPRVGHSGHRRRREPAS